MANYTWPPGLPQKPLAASYGESHGVRVARTPMDAGPAKLRYLGKRPETITCTFVVSAALVETLRGFVAETIFGVRRFNFPHPRTLATVEVRIIPGGDGEYFSLTNVGGLNYHASITLEVLP